MDEYINKRLAVEELENLRQQYEMHDDCDELVAAKCKAVVASLPDADVAPVVHGRWERRYAANGIVTKQTCSNCNEWVPLQIEPYKYCPYCGAKMD